MVGAEVVIVVVVVVVPYGLFGCGDYEPLLLGRYGARCGGSAIRPGCIAAGARRGVLRILMRILMGILILKRILTTPK